MIFYPKRTCAQGRTRVLFLTAAPTGALVGRGENPCVVTGGFAEPPAAGVVWQQSSFIGS